LYITVVNNQNIPSLEGYYIMIKINDSEYLGFKFTQIGFSFM